MCGSLAELLCSRDESIALQTESCACVLGISGRRRCKGLDQGRRTAASQTS